MPNRHPQRRMSCVRLRAARAEGWGEGAKLNKLKTGLKILNQAQNDKSGFLFYFL